MGNGPFGTGTDLREREPTSGNRKWPWCRTLGYVNKIEKSLNSLIVNHLRVRALFVRAKGLEPLHRKAPDPKSGLSTNFNTPAFICYLPPQVTCHWLPLVNCRVWTAKVRILCNLSKIIFFSRHEFSISLYN